MIFWVSCLEFMVRYKSCVEVVFGMSVENFTSELLKTWSLHLGGVSINFILQVVAIHLWGYTIWSHTVPGLPGRSNVGPRLGWQKHTKAAICLKEDAQGGCSSYIDFSEFGMIWSSSYNWPCFPCLWTWKDLELLKLFRWPNIWLFWGCYDTEKWPSASTGASPLVFQWPLRGGRHIL